MELLACDGCHATAPVRRGMAAWFRIETMGLEIVSSTHWGESPWHFCSRVCMARWALGKVHLEDQEEGVSDG